MISTRQSDTVDSVVSSDGTVIGYRQMGAGPGLILVHGGMQLSQNLMKLASALCHRFTVYIPDRRGRGLSGSTGPRRAVEDCCEDMRALVEKTGATNIFGLSSGALVSLWSALKMPGIRKLALYEPPLSINHSVSMAWVSRYEREVAQGKLGSAFVTVMKGVQVSPVLQALPRFLLTPFFELALRKEHDAEGVSLKALVPTMRVDAQIVIESAEKIAEFRNLKADVLLMGGSRGPAFLRIALDELNRILPWARRVRFPGLDHLGSDNSGKPGVVAEELLRFFEEA
jgi:pimeloyl-ACP methyl ester carboxylesterase